MIKQQQIGSDQLAMPLSGIAYLLSVLQASLLDLLPHKKLGLNQSQQEQPGEEQGSSSQVALQNFDGFLEKGISTYGVGKVCVALSNTFSLLFAIQNNQAKQFIEKDVEALCESVMSVANRQQKFCEHLLFKSKHFNGGILVSFLPKVVDNSDSSLGDSEKTRQRFFVPNLWHKFLIFIHIEQDYRKKLSAADWVKALVGNKCTLQELASYRPAVEGIAAVFVKAFNGKISKTDMQTGFNEVCGKLGLGTDVKGLENLLLVAGVFNNESYRHYQWLFNELNKLDKTGFSQPQISAGLQTQDASKPQQVIPAAPTQTINLVTEDEGEQDFLMELEDEDVIVAVPSRPISPLQYPSVDENLGSPDFLLPMGSPSPIVQTPLTRKRASETIPTDDPCSTPQGTPIKNSRIHSPVDLATLATEDQSSIVFDEIEPRFVCDTKELARSESDLFRSSTPTISEPDDDDLNDAISLNSDDDEIDCFAELPPDTVDLRAEMLAAR